MVQSFSPSRHDPAPEKATPMPTLAPKSASVMPKMGQSAPIKKIGAKAPIISMITIP